MNRNGIDNVDKSAQVCLVNMEPVFESDVHITWNVCVHSYQKVNRRLQKYHPAYPVLYSFFYFCLIFHRYFSGSFSIYGIQEFLMILMIFKWSYQLINFYNYPLISFKKSRRLFPPFFSDILQCT